MTLPPILIDLPHGLGVSGVVSWAIRLTHAWVQRGGRAGLLVHPTLSGYVGDVCKPHPDVRVFAAPSELSLEHAASNLGPFVRNVSHAIRSLRSDLDSPVILSPNLAAGSYGVAAALSISEPESHRTVAWQHSDTAFDTAVLTRYAEIIARFVPVSKHIESTLRSAIPHRSSDIRRIPYGIPIPSRVTRDSYDKLRIIYTGRIDLEQKRIRAICSMAEHLERSSVEHELLLLGDGPANDEVDSRLAALPHARREPAANPGRVSQALADSDIFALASRYEGLSVSMLEAMASGCVPVVTRVASGSMEVIEDGTNGITVPADEDMSDSEVGARLADAIIALRGHDCRAALSARAAATVVDRFSIERHVAAVEQLTAEMIQEPSRPWPTNRSIAGDGASHTSATVPPDASIRAREALDTIAALDGTRRVAVYGTGTHTIAIADALSQPSPSIICMIDDDPRKHNGTFWGYRICSLVDAIDLGVTDILLSSWIHRDTLRKRCRRVIDAGITVHSLYDDN